MVRRVAASLTRASGRVAAADVPLAVNTLGARHTSGSTGRVLCGIASLTGATIEVVRTRRTRRARGAAFSRRVMVGTLLTCSTAGGKITRNTRGALCPGKDAIATACPGPSASVTLSAGHGYLRANGPVKLGIVINP